MASWRMRGRRLYLTASYRRDGKVKTRYLRNWGSLQEALADLSDAHVVAALRRKAKDLDVAKLRSQLDTPGRFERVPRHAQTELRRVVGNPCWNGAIEWNFDREFWKRLTGSMIEKAGLANLGDLDYVTTLDARDAIRAFQIDFKAATRDLQRRLLSYQRKVLKSTAETRAELREAMETLGIDGPIGKLDEREVKKKYRMLARAYHPDRGGSRELFERGTAARDLLMNYLDGARNR